MNKIIVLMIFAFAACTSNTKQDAVNETDSTATHHETQAGLQLNNGAKWKTDEATKRNVGVLQSIANDRTSGANNATVANRLQSALDTLIKQCTMQGADHEALHQWLQPVIHGVKEMKEEKGKEGTEAIVALRTELARFNEYFE